MNRFSLKVDQVSGKTWLLLMALAVVGLVGVLVAAALSSSQQESTTSGVHPELTDSAEIDGLTLLEGMVAPQSGIYAPERGVIVVTAASDGTAIAKAEVQTNGSYRLRVDSGDVLTGFSAESGEVSLHLHAEFDNRNYEQEVSLWLDEIAAAEANGSLVATVDIAEPNG